MMFNDLPLELEREILSKVPATSLTQLRSTCKRWLALFKDPIFIKKNMENSKAATQVILKITQSVYSVNINLPDKSIEFTGKLKSLKDPQHVNISRIIHCDGLLLCTMMRGNDNVHVVWNPCTGQTRWIPPSPSSNRNTACLDCYVSYNYVLGYGNSYKILRICYYNTLSRLKREVKVELDIYEFSSDSWRVLDDVKVKWIIRSRQVSLKGNSYWIGWDKNNKDKEYPNNKFLLKFDFKRERFESLSLPSECNNDQRVNVVLSAVGQEKLYVLVEKFNVTSLEVKIWVTDTNKFDEAKDIIQIQYSLVIDSGIITRQGMKTVDSFLVDEENKRVVCCGDDGEKEESALIYILGNDQDCNDNVCKQVHGMTVHQQSAEVWNVYWPHLFSYVPTLVQIQ